MTANFSITDVAEKVAQANRQGNSGTEYWLRIFRALHTATIFPADYYRGHGRTAAALYNRDSLCLAGIAAALTRVARLEPQAMREALPVIRTAGASDSASKIRPLVGATLARAVTGVADGEHWQLRITLVDDAPTMRFGAEFRQVGEERPERSQRVESTLRNVSTARLAGAIVLDLNHVLAPYLSDAG